MDHIFVMVAIIYYKNILVLKILLLLILKRYKKDIKKREAKKLITNSNLIDERGIL